MNKGLKILLVFLIIVFIIVSFLYFKPYKLSDDIFNNNEISLIFQRRFTKCNVKMTIKDKDLNDVIKNDLLKDGYKLKNKDYVKSVNLAKRCDVLYKNYDKKEEIINLKGEDSLEIELNSNYLDPGYNYNGNNKVSVINDINTSKIGEQYLFYKINNKLYSKYITRKVIVKDSVAPVITLKGGSTLNLYIGTIYKELGYTAVDNYDGDITDKVVISGNVDTNIVGNYQIMYKVTDASNNSSEVKRIINVLDNPPSVVPYDTNAVTTPTYINGILIANKKYALSKDYNPGVDDTAYKALLSMQEAANSNGYDLTLLSGFRSYNTQYNLYNNYVKRYGKEKTDTFSARPGYSEHQTGLAFDIGKIDDNFGDTPSGIWLANNCHLYGFIVRYPKDKQNITGYKYEPWHVRYLGVDIATSVKESGLTLEEYLGIN